MEMSNEEKARLKRYLMGKLGEEDQREIGEGMITDDQYVVQMEILEDELIDDYLSGNLSPEEQYRFETHFLNPPSRQEKLQFAQALRRYVKNETKVGVAACASEARSPVSTQTPKSRPILSLAFKVAAGVAVVVLAGFTVYRLFLYESDLERGQNLFKDLYKSERPVRSRISTLEWAPFDDARRVVKGPEKGDVRKESVGLKLEQALKEDPSPASEHAFGLFKLATKRFDEAVAHLSSAAGGDPRNAAYHSDLGAALLEKGEFERLNGDESEASKDLARGLEELDLALSISPDLAPALFNRALCFEAMQRWREAEVAWLTYLAKDLSSQWATEDARRRLDIVRQKL